MSPPIEVPERIEGARVNLRPIRERDVAPWAAAFVDDRDLGPAWGIEENLGEEDLRDRIQGMADAAAAGRAVELTIADAADDRLLGSAILHSFDWRSAHAEVGFWLLESERGKGAAFEGVGLTIDWAFRELGLHRVEMVTLPALPHTEDVRRLAARLGLREEGVMRGRNFERGVRHDTLMLAVLRDEWSFAVAE